MNDLPIYEEIIRLTREGLPYALATVIESNGSSPRKPGAKMLVRHDGTILGTIGGGRVENETIQAALESLRSGKPATVSFVLTEEHGFACGGSLGIYVEPHAAAHRVVMFGGGHVGRAVTHLAHECGFHVTVVDSREEMANRRDLPCADDILCCPDLETFGRITVTPATAIIIATTSHELDFGVARGALGTNAGFIGLVGSRRKREALYEALVKEKFTARQVERIVSPVGIAIGAETPAEIAVSIVAQLIQLRRVHATESICTAPGRGTVAAHGVLQAASPP
jgi:xanthine dehydrogenase accessory factor